MEDCLASLCGKRKKTREPSQRGTEPSQQGHELQPSQPRRQESGTEGISLVPAESGGPSNQQKGKGKGKGKGKEPQREGTLREVAGADFNKYIRVDKIEPKFDPIDAKHEIGHSFSACFHVTNTTPDILKFTTYPALEWKEIIHKKDGAEGKTETEEFDQYAKKSDSATFIGWRWGWDIPIQPHETKQIIIQDNARVRNIDKNDRTVSRSIEFDIGVPGNGPRLKATQNIEVINGVKKRLDFKIH